MLPRAAVGALPTAGSGGRVSQVRVVIEADTEQFMRELRRAMFLTYQAAQWWGLPERYRMGIRAREEGMRR